MILSIKAHCVLRLDQTNGAGGECGKGESKTGGLEEAPLQVGGRCCCRTGGGINRTSDDDMGHILDLQTDEDQIK